MMNKNQNRIALIFGSIIGLLATAGLLVVNIPENKKPEATVALTASIDTGFLITPKPFYPKPFLETADLEVAPETAVVSVSSARSETANVSLELDKSSKLSRQPEAENIVFYLEDSLTGEKQERKLSELKANPFSFSIRQAESKQLFFQVELLKKSQLAGELIEVNFKPVVNLSPGGVKANAS